MTTPMRKQIFMALALLAVTGVPEVPPEEASGDGKWCPRPDYPSEWWADGERLADLERAARLMGFAMSSPTPGEKWPDQAREAAFSLAAALESAPPNWGYQPRKRTEIMTLVDDLSCLA